MLRQCSVNTVNMNARVKELKGNGKTVSRKAVKSGRASGNFTPEGSPMASLLTSPTHSQPTSRVTSDISDCEYEDDADEMGCSVHSAGSMSEAADEAAASFDAKALLEQLQDRKHNNSEARELYLEVYVKVMRTRYNAETHIWLEEAANRLAELFLRDASRGITARERLLSLQAYCLTVATAENVDACEAGQKILKQVIADDDDDDCRVYAIYALCITVLYGGGAEEGALELMEYLVEIVQTDGESIEAHDNVAIVVASLQGWAFVASHVDDYSDYADTALDAFVDQLDSADVEIQSNAAACIALVFESSRTHEQETGEPFELPYDPQRLVGRISELAKLSAKSVSKRHRRDLRESLVSVITSLERGVGPFYSTALYIPGKDDNVPARLRTEDGSAEYGYRSKLRLGTSVATIDTWSLQSRVNMLKIIFRGGLHKHVFTNPVVIECLEDADFDEFVVDESDRKASKSRKKVSKDV